MILRHQNIFFTPSAYIKNFILLGIATLNMAKLWQEKRKKRYKHAKIGKKKYYHAIRWIDISGDAGHATPEEFDKFECAKMVTQAYVYKKTKKFLWTFSSYDEKEEVFSDRNIFPIGCIISMEKILN